jgi:hypothetical protein
VVVLEGEADLGEAGGGARPTGGPAWVGVPARLLTPA